jgi:class 3 adenylate cyclase
MFGRYLVRRLLGAGGMASVFLAEDTLSRRQVALKVMSQELETDPEYRARFVREARLLLGLRHPNVVQVLDAGEEAGRPYFCMEYLEGEDLEQRIRRAGPLHWRDALGFMRQALLGLAAAWQAGVVHRDVKPENLFVTAGVLKVMDFGVARPLVADGFQTQMGMVVGTPAYIAPEQAMGRKVDFRADLYALGATFWHVMAGRTPYGEGSPTALCNCHVYEPFPSLAALLPSAPRGVVDLMARLAEKDPANRGDQQSTLMAIDALLALPVTDAPRMAVAGPRMVVENGRMTGTLVAVPEGELIIGRMPGCGLVLDDARASRRHAVVARRGAFLEVRDLGSRNGVLLNGHPIQTAPLAEGDRVTVGDTVMRVEGLSGTYTDPIVTSGKGYSPQELGLASPPQSNPSMPLPAQVVPQPSAPVVMSQMQMGPSGVAGAAVGAVGQKEVLHSRHEQAGFDRLADGRMAAATPLSRHLQILYRLGKSVAGALDMPDLGRRVMDLVWEAVPFDRGFVLLEGAAVGADGRREWQPISSRDAHGNAVTGRPSATVLKKVRDEGVSLQTADATTDQRLDMAASVMNLRIRGVLCAPMWAGDQMIGAIYVDRGTQRPFVAEELITLEAVADFAGTAFQQHLQTARARAANRMVEDLARFVAPEVKAELDRKSERDIAALLSHREMSAAVLFCDIQGFTPLCERLKPGEVATLLTQYFNALTDAVMAERGSLNKFIGDACMGLFGVPLPLDNNSLRAVQAGAGIIRRMAELQATLPEDRRFKVRVGINTGVVVAGAFGSERRMEYTVLGDVVNTAARLEAAATPMGIMVGEQTYQDVKDVVACTSRGSIAVKGKAQPIPAYEIHVPGITGAS